MDATLMKKADELAEEFAGQATTLEELNEVMRALMKTALERMLTTELDSHLGRVSSTGIQPRGHSRSTEHLPGGHRAGGRTGIEDVWRTLGHEISHDLQTVEGEVAAHHLDVRPARCDPQSDLHDEHD